MLPASNKEKFIARYLVLVVVMPLAAILGFFAGDVLQYLMSLMINSDAAQWATSALTEGLNNSGIFHFYTNLNGDPSPVEGFLVILLGTITQHACFLLFGSIYHKHPLVMAILTWMGIGILLLMLGASAAKLLTDFLDSGYTIIMVECPLLRSQHRAHHLLLLVRLPPLHPAAGHQQPMDQQIKGNHIVL